MKVKKFFKKLWSWYLKSKIVVKIAVAIGLVILLVASSFYVRSIVKNKKMVTSNVVANYLQNIGELATQEAIFTNVQVIENVNQLWGINIPGTHSKAIFSYDGSVKAGFDFAEITIEPDSANKVVNVRLPKTKILSSEIDVDSLMIYDERTALFNPIKIGDYNSSLAELKEEAERKAVERGLLVAAVDNAKLIIQSFLASSYPPEEYTIEFVQ